MTTTAEKHSKPSVSKKDQNLWQRRNLLTSAVFALLAGLALVGFYAYTYLAQSNTAWQIIIGGASAAVLALVTIGVLWLVQRGRVSLGAWVLIIAVWLVMIVISLSLANIGQILSITAFVVTIGLSILTLSQQSVVRVILLGLIFRFVIEIGARSYQDWQLILSGVERFVNIAAILLLVVFGLLIIRQFRVLSLANKLVLVFIFLTLLGTSVLSNFNTANTSRILTDNIGQSLKSQADAQARLIGDLLQREVTSVRALATNPVLRNRVDQANWAYHGDEAAIQAEITQLDQEWITAVSKGETIPLMTNRLENIAASKLEEFQIISQDNVEIFVTDRYGAVVGASQITSDYAQADERWWQEAYNEGWGAVYIGSPVYDESTRASVIQIAVPISDLTTGKLIGILRVSYRIDPITKMVGGVRMGKTGVLDIYFPGTVNLHFREGELELVDSAQIGRLQLIKDVPYGRILYEGSDSMASRSQVKSTVEDLYIDNLGWYVVSNQQATEALAPVASQQRINQLLVSVLVVFVSLGALGLSQIVAGPVVRLTGVADRIRAGDLSAQARVDSSDEVGALADTFNQMTVQLREILAGLEQRVSERTREMTLSAEVSRTLGQVRDLDQLLNQAVVLIQSSFDLYYTQVYLMDSTGQTLILRSGTGDVGTELLRRGHRLAVGPGSINGLAATEQHPVLVSDTETSPIFRPNPLLPETRSELSVPLRVGERVVGVLDMQSARPGALSEENLAAFETLAGQLAIAIDNAELIAQAERARDEMEKHASRLTAEGWVEYLDAIQHSERLGYVYDGETIQPITELQPRTPDSNASAASILSLPVTVLGLPVGQISLEREAENRWSQSEMDLVDAVAGQVARQIENLRLLAQAEQYRLEAEESARRLTREGWQVYLETAFQEAEFSFTYDGQRVQETATEAERSAILKAPAADSLAEREIYVHPLKVRDVAIGELVLEGELTEDEDRRTVEFVAERLAEHLENLRLASQTDLALASTEALYAGSEAIVRSNTVDGVLQAIINASALGQFDHARVMIFDVPWIDKMPAAAVVAGTWELDGSEPEMQKGDMVQMVEKRFVTMLQRGEPFYVPDIQDAENVDDPRRIIQAEEGRSVAFFPLVAADQWIGWLEVIANSPVYLTEAQLRQAQSLVGQAAAVVQGIRLLQQSEALARREQTLRQMSERLRSAVDPEQVLRTAAKEVGQVLGRTVLIRLGGSQTDEKPN